MSDSASTTLYLIDFIHVKMIILVITPNPADPPERLTWTES